MVTVSGCFAGMAEGSKVAAAPDNVGMERPSRESPDYGGKPGVDHAMPCFVYLESGRRAPVVRRERAPWCLLPGSGDGRRHQVFRAIDFPVTGAKRDANLRDCSFVG